MSRWGVRESKPHDLVLYRSHHLNRAMSLRLTCNSRSCESCPERKARDRARRLVAALDELTVRGDGFTGWLADDLHTGAIAPERRKVTGQRLRRAGAAGVIIPHDTRQTAVAVVVPEEKRDMCADLGFDAVTVNSLSLLTDRASPPASPEDVSPLQDRLRYVFSRLLLAVPEGKRAGGIGMYSDPQLRWCPGCGMDVWHQVLIEGDKLCRWCGAVTEERWNWWEDLPREELEKLAGRAVASGFNPWRFPDGYGFIVDTRSREDFEALRVALKSNAGEEADTAQVVDELGDAELARLVEAAIRRRMGTIGEEVGSTP